MRILIWNMNKQRAAWDYLLSRADEFDVALVQEIRDPRLELGANWASVHWRPMNGKPGSPRTRWGSAVIAPEVALEPWEPGPAHPWLTTFGGSATVARALEGPIRWFASVHTHASAVPAQVLAQHDHTSVPRCAPNGTIWEQDLIPHELHQLFARDTFLWGGDLNSAESMDEPAAAGVGGNVRLREIWRAAGSTDLRLRFHAEEQQTFFRRGRRPYQLDHAFADAKTETAVTGWEVLREPVDRSPPVSDHAPILITL